MIINPTLYKSLIKLIFNKSSMRSQKITQNINFKCSFCGVSFSSFRLPYLSCKNCHSLCERCFYQIQQNVRAKSLCPLCNFPVFQETIINRCLLRQIQAASLYQQLQLKYQKLSQIKNSQVNQSTNIKNQQIIHLSQNNSKQQNKFKRIGQEISKFLKYNDLTIVGAFVKMMSQIVRIVSKVIFLLIILIIINNQCTSWLQTNLQNGKKIKQNQLKIMFFIANTIAIATYVFWSIIVRIYKLLYPIIYLVGSMIQSLIYGVPISYIIQFILYQINFYDEEYLKTYKVSVQQMRNQTRMYIIGWITFILPWIVILYNCCKKQKPNLQKAN